MADETKETLEQEPHGSNSAADELAEWKASSRKWEELAKKNKNAAKELEELKSQLAESQEAAAKATAEAEELKAKAERNSWIEQASKATGVPVAALHGSTKEEVDACAEALKEYFAKPSAPVVDTGNPSADEGVSLTTSQFVTAPKLKVTRVTNYLGLTTSQFVTAPKPLVLATISFRSLTTSQFVTAPKLG